MRAEELVRRADDDVRVPRNHVDRAVRAVVDGIHPGERSGLVREIDHGADVGSRPHRVGRGREGDHAGAVAQLRRAARSRSSERSSRTSAIRTTTPRSSCRWSHGATFAVVIEGGDDDLVAGPELAPERPREEEVERRHARPERDLAGAAAHERGRLRMSELDELIGSLRGGVRRADVGVVLAQVTADGVDHLVRALRATRPVEEREPPLQRGEPCPHRGYIERLDRAHARPSPASAPGRQSRPPPPPGAARGTRLSGPVPSYCALRPGTARDARGPRVVDGFDTEGLTRSAPR